LVDPLEPLFSLRHGLGRRPLFDSQRRGDRFAQLMLPTEEVRRVMRSEGLFHLGQQAWSLSAGREVAFGLQPSRRSSCCVSEASLRPSGRRGDRGPQAFINILSRNGVAGLLTLATQKLTRDAVNDPGSFFRTQYGPTTLVHSTYPREDVDFEYGGA